MLLHFGGHTYEVIEQALNWKDARAVAKNWGGQLAAINSAAENKAVFNFLKKASTKWQEKYIAPDGGNAQYVWLGANDLAKEGSWKWSDGSKLKYTNWGFGGEPDNYQNQDAAAIALTSWPFGKTGQWNDIKITNGLYALVEFDGLLGTNGKDTIKGSSLSETFYGGAGADTLRGNGGNDKINGGTGNDKLYGGAGKDTLNGDAGNDLLRGDAGNDTLYGGAGADKLYGGAGKDTFVFKSAKETTVATKGRDTIYDFEGKAGDRIDLKGIDANTKVKGDQAFKFIGTDAFSKKAGELRYEKKASDAYVYGDTNGDGKADFAIHFDDALTFSKGHFLL